MTIKGEEDMGSREAIERAQLEALERLATSRMQVAALHAALKAARNDLTGTFGQLESSPTVRDIDEALNYGEPDGIAMFATVRSLVMAARDPERGAEVQQLADRLEAMIGTCDGL